MSKYERGYKEELQCHYGGYCKMCRELRVEYKRYHDFDMEEYDKIKKKYKLFKKKNKALKEAVENRPVPMNGFITFGDSDVISQPIDKSGKTLHIKEKE